MLCRALRGVCGTRPSIHATLFAATRLVIWLRQLIELDGTTRRFAAEARRYWWVHALRMRGRWLTPRLRKANLLYDTRPMGPATFGELSAFTVFGIPLRQS
jgi:hypothetical protein